MCWQELLKPMGEGRLQGVKTPPKKYKLGREVTIFDSGQSYSVISLCVLCGRHEAR